MSLDTYDGLRQEIADYLTRDDLTAKIPTFVTLAEKQIKRRLRRTKSRITVQFHGASFQIPDTIAEITSVRLVTSQPSQDLPFTIGTPEMIAEHRAAYGIVAGRPRFGAVVGKELLLSPAADQTYDAELIVYPSMTSLSSSVQTNTVLTEAPDVYLFGALMEAEPYLDNDGRIATWETKYEKALKELQLLRDREEYSASLRPQRLPVVFG
jgi:hypothetical protein